MYVLRGSAKRAPHFGNGNRHPKFYWRNHRWSRFHRCRANSYFSHHTSSTPEEKRPSCDDLWASFGGGARRAPPFWWKLNTIKKFLNHLSFGLVVRQMAKFPYTRAWSSTTLPVTDYCWQVVHRKRMDDQSECEWPMHHCDITCCWGCKMGMVECWNEWRKMTNYEWCDRWNNTHLHRLGFCGHNVITW